MATMKDVAQRAGVGLGTVSRFINNPNAVKESTRIKVENAVKELNYQPNVTDTLKETIHDRLNETFLYSLS